MDQSFAFITTLIGGAFGVWMCTEIAKRIPAFPLFKGETVKIRSFTALLSAIVVFISSWAQGSLAAVDVQNLLIALVTFIGVWLGSHGVYEATKSGEDV